VSFIQTNISLSNKLINVIYSNNNNKCKVDVSFSNALNRVDIDICIRDDHVTFVLARNECVSPILEVDTWGSLDLLTIMNWVRLNYNWLIWSLKWIQRPLWIVSIYDKKNNILDIGFIINDCWTFFFFYRQWLLKLIWYGPCELLCYVKNKTNQLMTSA